MPDSILIVDDEKGICDNLARYLSHDYIVYTASNGHDAIKKVLEHNEITIILTDMRMPGMCGIELLEKVSSTNTNIFFIFITGSSTVKTAVEAMRKGAYDYFTKPVDLYRLGNTIKNAIEKNKALF